MHEECEFVDFSTSLICLYSEFPESIFCFFNEHHKSYFSRVNHARFKIILRYSITARKSLGANLWRTTVVPLLRLRERSWPAAATDPLRRRAGVRMQHRETAVSNSTLELPHERITDRAARQSEI